MPDPAIDAAMQRGDWDSAIALCQSELRSQPTNPKLHAFIGLCHFRRNRFEQALDPLRRAVLLDPKFVDAGVKLAQCLDRLCRYAEAHEVAETMLTVSPGNRTLQGLVSALQDHRDRTYTDGWERTRRLDRVAVTLASEEGETYVLQVEEETQKPQPVHVRLPRTAEGLA